MRNIGYILGVWITGLVTMASIGMVMIVGGAPVVAAVSCLMTMMVMSLFAAV